MNTDELIEKLGEWRALTLNARDNTERLVKYAELTGQLNAIDATTALVRALAEDLKKKGGEEE